MTRLRILAVGVLALMLGFGRGRGVIKRWASGLGPRLCVRGVEGGCGGAMVSRRPQTGLAGYGRRRGS